MCLSSGIESATERRCRWAHLLAQCFSRTTRNPKGSHRKSEGQVKGETLKENHSPPTSFRRAGPEAARQLAPSHATFGGAIGIGEGAKNLAALGL